MNKYQSFIPQKFTEIELTKRVKAAQGWVDTNKILVEDSVRFLDVYDAMIKSGYIRSPDQPMLIMQSLVQVILKKPKKILNKEYEQIAVQVETEYRAEIKADQESALERMANRLLCEAKEKQEKEMAAVQAELEAAALVEAAAILGLEGAV
jgi:uncharacterized protein with von Willebrand factor type A (vWA) domain